MNLGIYTHRNIKIWSSFLTIVHLSLFNQLMIQIVFCFFHNLGGDYERQLAWAKVFFDLHLIFLELAKNGKIPPYSLYDTRRAPGCAEAASFDRLRAVKWAYHGSKFNSHQSVGRTPLLLFSQRWLLFLRILKCCFSERWRTLIWHITWC